MNKFKKDNSKTVLGNAGKTPVDREFLKSLREDLVLYMKANPVVSRSVHLSASPLFFRRLAGVPAMAGLISIILGSGTVFASQNSLPGDGLYPIKILTEEIRVTAAFTAEDRVAARLRFAQKRVNELWALSQRNTAELAPLHSRESEASKAETENALQSTINNFNSQLASAFEEVEKMKAKNNSGKVLELSSDIKVSTEVFRQIISLDKEKTEEVFQASFDKLISSSNDFGAKADSTIKESEDGDIKKSVDESEMARKLETSKSKIEEAKRAVETSRESMPMIFREKLESDIKNAEERLNKARDHFEKKELTDASKEANESLESAWDARSLIKATSNLNPETVERLNRKNRGDGRGGNRGKDNEENNEREENSRNSGGNVILSAPASSSGGRLPQPATSSSSSSVQQVAPSSVATSSSGTDGSSGSFGPSVTGGATGSQSLITTSTPPTSSPDGSLSPSGDDPDSSDDDNSGRGGSSGSGNDNPGDDEEDESGKGKDH